MPVLNALPSIDIIRGFKGILDFYLWKGIPCVRSWPHTPPHRRTEGTIAAASLFGWITKSYRLVAPTALEAYQQNAKGIPRTPRDVYVSGVLGHLHERTTPLTPPAHFTIWLPDAPPLAPSPLDDEFNDAVFDNILWTEFDPDGDLTVSENETGLILDLISDPALNLVGVYQPIPAGDFTIVANIHLIAFAATGSHIGLCLWDDATNVAAGMYHWRLRCNVADQRIQLAYQTDYTTLDHQLYSEADDIIATHIYFRIRRIGANYYFAWSSNGIGWRRCWTSLLAFAPNHFGIALANVNTIVTLRGVATFFRYTPVGTFNLILHGDRVNVVRSP